VRFNRSMTKALIRFALMLMRVAADSTRLGSRLTGAQQGLG